MKSKAWYEAIRKANSKPKSKAHRRAISRARKGVIPKWKDPEGRTAAIVAARNRSIKHGGCKMCGSLKHTMEQHKRRMAIARSRSEKWRTAVVIAAKKAHTGVKASVKTRRKMSAKQSKVQNSPEQLALRTTHGETNKTPEYNAWHSMKTRCMNPNFIGWNRYGGRGISICRRWLNSFENFLKDVGRRPSSAHSLDRYPDPNGDYKPGNVRWATGKQQRKNRGQ